MTLVNTTSAWCAMQPSPKETRGKKEREGERGGGEERGKREREEGGEKREERGGEEGEREREEREGERIESGGLRREEARYDGDWLYGCLFQLVSVLHRHHPFQHTLYSATLQHRALSRQIP